VSAEGRLTSARARGRSVAGHDSRGERTRRSASCAARPSTTYYHSAAASLRDRSRRGTGCSGRPARQPAKPRHNPRRMPPRRSSARRRSACQSGSTGAWEWRRRSHSANSGSVSVVPSGRARATPDAFRPCNAPLDGTGTGKSRRPLGAGALGGDLVGDRHRDPALVAVKSAPPDLELGLASRQCLLDRRPGGGDRRLLPIAVEIPQFGGEQARPLGMTGTNRRAGEQQAPETGRPPSSPPPPDPGRPEATPVGLLPTGEAHGPQARPIG
jgi:hypothetical protein